jgi:hypothetical protein
MGNSMSNITSSAMSNSAAGNKTPAPTPANHMIENVMKTDNILISFNSPVLLEDFCGTVYTNLVDVIVPGNKLVYLCGDIATICTELGLLNLRKARMVYIIQNWSFSYEKYNFVPFQKIHSDEVPRNVHNVGLFIKCLFNSDKDYFYDLTSEHKFQVLKESNKPSNAYRKGIYITNVESLTNESLTNESSEDQLKFNLLRCSTNLDGPTDNFRKTDHEIVGKVQQIADDFFEQPVELNHVLAQVYYNVKAGDGPATKDARARIKEHSDKTKDMPRNALMAFCTFYKSGPELLKRNGYRYVDKRGTLSNASVLTKLRFRLKTKTENGYVDPVDEALVKEFDVELEPNSVFLMSLSTNRLYTHEIVPSGLPIEHIPTRLGYVIRCSNRAAIFKDERTHVYDDNESLVPLEEPSEDGLKYLKTKYFEENVSNKLIDYDFVKFSMNNGDYMRPIL